MSHSSRCIPVVIVLAAVAMIAAGCSDARFAASNASTDTGPGRESSYKASYGFSSDGPTTDVYTALFGSKKRDDNNAPTSVAATAQPGQPATGPGIRQGAAASAPGVNQQQAVAPEQPAGPPPQAAAFGLTSDGPTTDVYTALFGPQHRD